MIVCPSCGHDWVETRTLDITAEPPPQPPAKVEDAPDAEIRRLVSAGRQAQEAFELQRRQRRGRLAAWAGLALAAMTPAAVALAFPERTVSIAPAAIGLYDWLGRDVNIYGLEIRGIETQHLMVDGQRVLALKGEIVNASSSVRKIPWLRFGLKSAEASEVYNWQLDTESRALKPGEARSFVTRVAAPPETAASVEIRFARADEIGSNVKHE